MADRFPLAKVIAERYAALANVQAVALSGSSSSSMSDEKSDIDLYVYVDQMLSLADRGSVPLTPSQAEIGNNFWEPGDEWVEDGVSVDVMFRDILWIEDQLERVLRRHEASVGYSTCFWYNVRNSSPLFDRNGWFARLHERAQSPYPPELKRAIIAKNWPILSDNQSSYRRQIELAMERGDYVAVNHRITALLASYFDILFALNDQPHPGEKRLIRYVEKLCPIRPGGTTVDIAALMAHTSLEAIDKLVDGLESLLTDEGLIKKKGASVEAPPKSKAG